MWQLEFKHYLYPELHLKANKEHMPMAKRGERRAQETEIVIDYLLMEDSKMMHLSVQMHSGEVTELDPYEFKIEAFGMFNLTRMDVEDAPLDDEFEHMEKNLVLNGVQILVGSIRDCLHTVSAKSPYGALVLPTVYLGPEDMPEPQKVERQSD